jgi:hypothetical protein
MYYAEIQGTAAPFRWARRYPWSARRLARSQGARDRLLGRAMSEEGQQLYVPKSRGEV